MPLSSRRWGHRAAKGRAWLCWNHTREMHWKWLLSETYRCWAPGPGRVGIKVQAVVFLGTEDGGPRSSGGVP